MKTKYYYLLLFPLLFLLLTSIYFKCELKYRFIERIFIPSTIVLSDHTNNDIYEITIREYYHSDGILKYILNDNLTNQDYFKLFYWYVDKNIVYDWPLIIFSTCIIIQLLVVLFSLMYYYHYYCKTYWFIEIPFTILFILFSIAFWFIGSMHITGSGI